MNEKENTAATKPIIVQSAEGRVLHAFGDTIQIKLGGAQTGGNLVVGLASTPPGGAARRRTYTTTRTSCF